MLPPVARKKMEAWIRSRHLIFLDNFLIFETLDYSAIERFESSIASLNGTFISVAIKEKIWMGNHRQNNIGLSMEHFILGLINNSKCFIKKVYSESPNLRKSE